MPGSINLIELAPCLLWIVLPIWVLYLLGKIIMAEVDAMTGIVCILVALWLGFMTFMTDAPLMKPVILGLILGAIVFVPLANFVNDRVTDKAMKLEYAEGFYESLRRNPGNAVALFRLAELAAENGIRGHAVVLGQRAITGLPVAHYREEHKRLASWIHAVPQQEIAPVPCLACNTACPPGELYCPKCGAQFVRDYVRGGWLVESSLTKKLISLWLCATVLLIAIPAMKSYPPAIVVPALSAGATICVILTVGAFRKVGTR